MDNTLPSRCYASPRWILLVRRNFFEITALPNIFYIILVSRQLAISVAVCFAIFIFLSIQQKYQKYLSYYLYQISLLQVAVKGLTTPLSRWLQGS